MEQLERRRFFRLMGGAATGAAVVALPACSAGGALLDRGADGGGSADAGASAGDEYISVRSFGAHGDGTADDAAAIQAAIEAAAGNGTVYLPAGTYKVGSTLVLRGGTRLLGAGRVTLLLADLVGDLIQVSGFKATVSNLGFRSSRNDRTGAYIKNWSSSTQLGSYLRIEGCHFDGGFDVVVGDYGQDLCIVDCNLMGFSNFGIALGMTAHLENTYVSRCELVSDQMTAGAGIYVKDSGGLFISQVDIYGSGKMRDAINLDASPERPSIKWTFLDQVQCDSCLRDGLGANGTGEVAGLFCSNSWFSSNGNVGVNIGYNNSVSGTQLSGCQIFNNGNAGLNLQPKANQVTVNGCQVAGNGLVAAAPGINVAPGLSDIVITGTLVGPAAGFANSQTYGIYFGGEVTRCVVTGCSLSNNKNGATNSTPAGVTLSANV